MTEINFIDGQALTPSSFGETDAVTGVWKPKKYAGTYGTNGFYLNFSDNSSNTATTIGKDYSGNNNNWTPNNISVTSGVTYDSMIDVPTQWADGGNGRGNYAVLNPLDAFAGTMADGNLNWSGTFGTQNGHGARSSLRVRPSGKWYVEPSNITFSGSGNSCMLGFTTSTQIISASAFGGTLSTFIGVDASVFNNSVRFYSNGVSASGTNGTTLFASYASGDIINLAIDFDSGKIWAGKNGTWYNSGNPAAGTNETSSFTVGSEDWAFWAEYVAAGDNGNRSSVRANFGQRPFAYTPPTGFRALNTQNLPAPTILKGNQFFDATTWTGNGTSQSIVNSGAMQPDLVWAKQRSSTQWHRLIDAVRGTNKVLYSNDTSAEFTDTTQLTAFNSNGFSVGSEAGWNANTATYVGWQWKESATAGLDIVTYTGNGTNGRDVSHSLGVKPDMVIIKKRVNNSAGLTGNWIVQHKSLTAGVNATSTTFKLTSYTNGAVYLNGTFAQSSYGFDDQVNGNTDTFVAYLFSEVPGFSRFGSYTGNGSTDGPFVFCGFRPRFVMFKRTDTTSDWVMLDTARDTFNAAANMLFPHASNAEANVGAILDTLSNGFKLRYAGGTSINTSGGTYIFAAFAEHPFKNALAR